MNHLGSRLDRLLAAPWLKYGVIHSTNRVLLELDQAKVVDGITCTASRQTQGKGRADRVWNSPDGGLYLSILIQPDQPIQHWNHVSFIMACAGATAIKQMHPDIEPKLKWPNDILVNGRKVAGILIQSVSGSAPRIVAGIGVNVTTNPVYLPARPLYPATVINQESALPGNITGLAENIRNQFFRFFVKWEEDKTSLFATWQSMCAHKNRDLVVSTDDGLMEGKFLGISDDGALKLQTNERVTELLTGDIIEVLES